MSIETININAKQKFINVYQENISEIRNGSPEYINEIRDKAFEQFKILGVPNKKNEDYKHTDLSKEFDNGYKMYITPKNIKFKIDVS